MVRSSLPLTEGFRQRRGILFFETLLQDGRYAFRQLRKSPAFTFAAVATLALGIGANTAIFSVVNAVLLRPLPYPNPTRLALLWAGNPQASSLYSFSHPRFRYFEEHARPFADVAAYDDEIVTLRDHGEPERLEGGRVSANFFSVLGVSPALGRSFLASEDRHGAPPVALLSYDLWRKRYAGDRRVLGRAVRIDNDSYTVIGVLPAGFRFLGEPVDIWRSRIVDTRTFAPASVQLGARYLTVIARLHSEHAMKGAAAKFAAIDSQYKRDNPGNSDATASVYADALQHQTFANLRMTLLVLWGAVTCLLLIACANVANLVLARATVRSREVSLRVALGANRWRVAQQLIAESLLLSLTGGFISLPVALGGTRSLVAAIRQTSPAVPDAPLEPRVLAITFVVSALIGIAFGLAPLLVLRRAELESSLHSGGRSVSASTWNARFRNALVAAEVALCVALLSAAGLLAQSFLRMSTVATGLRPEKVLTWSLDLMPDRYRTPQDRLRFYDEVLRRVQTVPGVAASGITSRLDLVGSGLGYMLQVQGAPDLGPRNPGAVGRSVTPGYFGVIGIPLLRGRVFTEHDTASSARVMLVNEAFAKKFFPAQDPIGQHVTYSTDRITCEIVGVVRNVRSSLRQLGADEAFYLPNSQRPWLVSHAARTH